MDEMMDVYDEDQNLLGFTVERKKSFLEQGQFVLYVLAIIQDAQGRFLITQRTLDKYWGAGWWEVTGGGVAAGETAVETIVRECAEEVGLDVSSCDLEPVYCYKDIDLERGHNYIVDIFHFRLDFQEEDVTLQETEALDFRLATWDDITQLNNEGVFLHFERIRQALEAEASKAPQDEAAE